LPLIAT